MWSSATPEQRTLWLERQRVRRDAHRAALATPEGQAALSARQEQMRAWRAQRQAGIPLTPEQRAARRELFRQWRARHMTEVPPPTAEQRAARRERFWQWREARRARWQAENEPQTGNAQAETEGRDSPDR
jgi:hypothetical protein